MTLPASSQPLTIEQFEEKLFEGERWVELIEGRFVRLEPPDDAHGDVVRNLARSLASLLKTSTDTYACFELPLVVSRNPATVRCPAISCFRFESGNRFAETDKVMSETCPELVIEVASTNDRRSAMSDRIRAYLDWGVKGVWVIDPVIRHVHIFQGHNPGRMLKEPQVLTGHPLLPGLAIPVSDLFRQPDWASKTKAFPSDELN